jgi:hypothetical protein
MHFIKVCAPLIITGRQDKNKYSNEWTPPGKVKVVSELLSSWTLSIVQYPKKLENNG